MKEGSVIPHIALAQSTAQMDWSKLDLVVFATGSQKVTGLICLPSDKVLHKISLNKKNGVFTLEKDPFEGKVAWNQDVYKVTDLSGRRSLLAKISGNQ